MPVGMKSHLETIRSTRDLSIATFTAKAIMRLGPDAVEAIPTIADRSAKCGQFFFPYAATRWIEQCGPEAGTMALECSVRAFELATDPAYLITVAGTIKNLLEAGANGSSALPSLEKHLKKLTTVYNENRKKARGKMASDDPSLVVVLAGLGALVDILRAAVALAKKGTDSAESALSDHTIEMFALRSLKRRAAIALYLRDIGRVTDALVKAIQTRSPDASPEDAIGKATKSMELQCPSCGYLSEDAMSHLILSAKGAYEPGVMGECVVATGPKVSHLLLGQCPGCKGTLGVLAADLSPLGLVQRKWWDLWK